MESFFRLSEESLNELGGENGRLREESKGQHVSSSVEFFPGGLETELEIIQHPVQSLNSNQVVSTTSAKPPVAPAAAAGTAPSRYESQKRRDWNSFGQYLRNHRPPIHLEQCNDADVLDFLRYLDQFGKTKVHLSNCHYFGVPNPPHPCPCPLRQAWGSLDALIGRLRAAFEENGGKASMNPFGARLVRLYLREVRDKQSKARGIAYGKKKKGRISPQASMLPESSTTSGSIEQYGHHLAQVRSNDVHAGNGSNSFPVHETARSISSTTQGYGSESFMPSNNNAVNPVPRVYLPFEIHSFMEDIPSRGVNSNGWGWNPVCS